MNEIIKKVLSPILKNDKIYSVWEGALIFA